MGILHSLYVWYYNKLKETNMTAERTEDKSCNVVTPEAR